MIPQQPIVIDPGMIPAQGIPQTVYITEPMMGNYNNKFFIIVIIDIILLYIYFFLKKIFMY